MITFNNVYIKNTALVAGLIESRSVYSKFFDKTYKDYYMDKSYEKSEVMMQKDVINILLFKEKLKDTSINCLLGGDLLNQITASCYAAACYQIPFLGCYAACATSIEEIIMGSIMIDSYKINNCLCVTSSHNLAAEKQFRNPVEYGAPKKNSTTFTATGAAAILLTSSKSSVKVSSVSIGKVINFKQKDVNNMGRVMVPACASTLINHLKESGSSVSDYDLILSGDLGIYGKEIFKEYMKKEYKIDLVNYDDCGSMLYDLKKEKDVLAGGSGPVCSCLINYGYVFNLLQEKKLKRVLLLVTGALFSPTFVYQKEDLNAICHALEVIAV